MALPAIAELIAFGLTLETHRLLWAVQRQTSIYAGDFTIDTTTGIVRFAQPVMYLTRDGRRIRPDLRLRCAVTVRDPVTRAYVRRSLRVAVGTTPTPDRVLVHNEIIPSLYTDTKGALVTNFANVDQNLSYYANQATADYQTTNPQVATYAGIIQTPLDGAIQSVTFAVGGPFATTRVSRDDELTNPAAPPRKLRKFFQAAGVAIATAAIAPRTFVPEPDR